MKTLTILLGTRPEAIKLMPLVLEARSRTDRWRVQVVSTAQHREMLDAVFRQFGVTPDVDLDLMQHGQEPGQVLARVLTAVDHLLQDQATDCMVVQGDTMTTLAGALAASYRQIPVAHVEAGLRSGDRSHPWPEEDNRRLVSRITDFHFAPTESSRTNLLLEGVAEEDCWVTGNTGLDSLRLVHAQQVQRDPDAAGSAARASGPDAVLAPNRILLTCHRRESFGEAMVSICRAVLRLRDDFPHLEVQVPVHRNPNVRSVLERHLGGQERIQLSDPLNYSSFVAAMADSDLILTDSGGVQEEAPSLGKPVLVLRETTERPEAVEAGVAKLVGTDPDRIVAEADRLLRDPVAYAAMARIANPFGDGYAAPRILDALEYRL